MYRVGVEAMLGITLQRGALRIDPCIPRAWKGYEVTFRSPTRRSSRSASRTRTASAAACGRVEVDGVEQANLLIPLRRR